MTVLVEIQSKKVTNLAPWNRLCRRGHLWSGFTISVVPEDSNQRGYTKCFLRILISAFWMLPRMNKYEYEYDYRLGNTASFESE